MINWPEMLGQLRTGPPASGSSVLNFQRRGHFFRYHAGCLGSGGVATGRKQREAQANHLLGFEAGLPEVEGKAQPG